MELIPDLALLVAVMLAGMISVLVPGHATVAVLCLSATRGGRAAFSFLRAHLAGDLFWTLMALLSLAGISRLGSGLFDLPGLACGIWFCGLIFGFANPRAWPFALALLTRAMGVIIIGFGLKTLPDIANSLRGRA